MKIGRNNLCPCGSGKKYKKCCTGKHKPAEQAALTPFIITDEDPLDQLSNQVGDWIDEEEYEQAQRGCEKLLKEYPEVIDGYFRFAALYEKKSDTDKAIKCYQKCITHIKNKVVGFNPELVEYYKSKIQRLKEGKRA